MPHYKKSSRAAIANWLFACGGLVFIMVVIGAITRLTDSGLSMVEWRPLIGALPPLGENEWNRVFALYQQTPEYQKQNFWMDLQEFKQIFFWEWFHRFMGRLIGIAFALPMLWLWIKHKIPTGYHLRFIGLLALGGLQGIIGWYMVKSGLVDRPDVSHYRLALHLSAAFLIFALLIWTGLSLKPLKPSQNKALYYHGWIITGLFTITVFWGAFTAGQDAGLLYNDTFPQMGNTMIPPDMWQNPVLWLNFFETHSAIQFTHRWLAIFFVLMVCGYCAHAIRKNIKLPSIYLLTAMAFIQMGLGIATLFTHVSLPFAILHQSGALLTLFLLVACLHQTQPRRDQMVQID